jgi:prevent-host-death family protein
MKEVSMVEFRLHADRVIAQVERGQRMILTRRGKPVARLEPIRDSAPSADDPFYAISDLAEASGSLSNAQIDELLYGP